MTASLPTFRLDGRIALVTGASAGLGRHFAALLAAAGAKVVAAARRQDALDSLVAEISDAGGTAAAVPLDVTDAASVTQAFDAAEQAFGTPDVLINNAGTAVGKAALEMTEADWDGVMDTNLKGAWRIAQEAARRLQRAERGGAIVNVASILGLRVTAGVAPYAISKAGIVQMTKALALELARLGIRVNAIAPGYVATEMNAEFLESDAGQRMTKRIPMRRVGEPDDLDGALLLLASDASRYMTGTVIPVDGGHLVGSL